MPLMADQFAIKVHFYSCLLLFVWSAIVIGRSAAAAATTANDTDHNDYNSSSSKGSYDNITTSLRVESARPTLTQSFTSALPTSSSPQPMRLTNVSAIDKVVPMSDITATRDLHPPHTSTTISLSKNFKFTHQAKELDVGKSSTKPGLTNLTEMASILSENTTKNENEDKMNTVQTASNSSNEVDKKPFPLKRHLTRSPSEDASHPDQSDGKQTEEAVFYANTTSNNEIHDFHPSNFSDGISLNSSVENNFNIPIVAANSSSFRRDNCTNQDPSELTKNRAVEKSEKPTDARNATVQKYPPSPLSSGTSLTPETINVSVTENYGNPTPSVHSTFDSQTPSLATKFATTATTTATTTTTTPIATIATTTIPTTTEFNGQERTFEQSAERHTSLSQFRSSERLFNVDDKRYEAVTILLLASANETVESLNKSVRKLEHKNDSRHERANDTDLQESDSLDGATYDESRELKRASAEKKAIDDADDRSDMTTRRRRRKNARRRKEKHIPFVPAEVTTTEPFPTRRHHHRYHPDNHRQQIIPPTGESSFSAEDSGDRRNVNSGRNKDRQRRPGRRERARTRDDPSLDIGRKQQQRNRLESPRHEGDNSLAVLSSAESGDEEEAYKYSSSPLALPPLRNRDPKRQRSPLPSYVHKRSPSGSFESNEIKPQTSSKRFTFSDCGKDPDRPIKFLKFRLDPAPIQLSTWGGKVKLSAKLNITKSLPPLVTADVTIIKFVVGVPIPVPCFNHMGTCHYKNLCKQLDELWNNLQTRYQKKTPDQPDPLESRDNDVESDSTPHTPPPPPPWRKPSPHLISPNHSACPRLLRSQYVPCKCPFYPSLYTLKKYIVPIPSLGFSSIFVEGEYEIKLEINDGADKSQLGCLKASFEMRRRERKVYII